MPAPRPPECLAGDEALARGAWPANMNHYAFTTAQETEIVLYGQGPVDVAYNATVQEAQRACTQTTSKRDVTGQIGPQLRDSDA